MYFFLWFLAGALSAIIALKLAIILTRTRIEFVERKEPAELFPTESEVEISRGGRFDGDPYGREMVVDPNSDEPLVATASVDPSGLFPPLVTGMVNAPAQALLWSKATGFPPEWWPPQMFDRLVMEFVTRGHSTLVAQNLAWVSLPTVAGWAPPKRLEPWPSRNDWRLP